MTIKKILPLFLSSILIASLSISPCVHAQEIQQNTISKENEVIKVDKVYTSNEFEELVKKELEEATSNLNEKETSITPNWATRKEWDHYEPKNHYLIRNKYYLGSCKFENNYTEPMSATYTQINTKQVSATFTGVVAAHADAKAAVLDFGLSISNSLSLSETFSSGQTIQATTTVKPGKSVILKAYMGGECINGTAVYKQYDDTGAFLDYVEQPANNNVLVSPTDLYLVAQ